MLGQVRNSRRDQDARFHLIVVAIPELLLFFRQAAEAVFTDDVLDSDQPSVGRIAIKPIFDT